MTDTTDELATELFELDTDGLATGATTAEITRAILRWALARGWSARTEARVGLEVVADRRTRVGYIDVIVRRGKGTPDLAIEIDSQDKKWSLSKLSHAAEAGMDAIWIRWGDDQWAGSYDGVDVIQLRASRRHARRPDGRDQLTLWY